ncbi:FAS1-like dehydratase domain-containing protein [Actinophytocola sp.]|uniref:FAS1-like dehydratase domain-containing protein n=1 Tax=Actinophytocola sp. TaxID=1872138 RepID=UPI003D6A8A1C
MTSSATFARITDELIEELRADIGKPIEGPPGFVSEATRDSIRHFALGVGDYNPLWIDEEHARRSTHGTLLAPPSMLFAFNRTAWGARGLRGIHSMFSGGRFEWHQPIRLGDTVSSSVTLKDLEIKERSEFAGRTIKQIREAEFRNQDGELIAVCHPYSFRMERDAARERGKYDHLTLASYSPEEYDAICAQYEQEVPRGAVTRYWEDVAVGEELPQLVRGPLTVTDIIVFLAGEGGQWLRAHGDAAGWYRRHPRGGIRNSVGALEPPEIVHWDHEFARRVGVPAAYDYGPQRVAWLTTLMTNWAGDDGHLQSLDVAVRRFNLVGDTTWCRGRVGATSVRDGRHLVECEIWAEDQRGERTATGTAVVALPSRSAS